MHKKSVGISCLVWEKEAGGIMREYQKGAEGMLKKVAKMAAATSSATGKIAFTTRG